MSFSSGCPLFCCLFGPAIRHTLLSCPSDVYLNRNLLGAMNHHTLMVACSPTGSTVSSERRAAIGCWCLARLASTNGSLPGTTNRHTLLVPFLSGGSLIFRFKRSFPCHMHCKTCSFVYGFITSSIDRSFKGNLCRVDSVCGIITSSAKGKCSRSSSFRPVACVLVDLGVWRRNARAADKMQTHTHKQTHTALLSI